MTTEAGRIENLRTDVKGITDHLRNLASKEQLEKMLPFISTIESPALRDIVAKDEVLFAAVGRLVTGICTPGHARTMSTTASSALGLPLTITDDDADKWRLIMDSIAFIAKLKQKETNIRNLLKQTLTKTEKQNLEGILKKNNCC